jgi:hypothetical protein
MPLRAEAAGGLRLGDVLARMVWEGCPCQELFTGGGYSGDARDGWNRNVPIQRLRGGKFLG